MFSRVAYLSLLAFIALVRCQNTELSTSYSSTSGPPVTTTVPPTTSTIEQNGTTTTTSAPPEPTPTLPPTPTPGDWKVQINPNNTCIRAQFGAQIIIKYNDSNLNKTVTTGFNIDGNATVDETESSCNKSNQQILVLKFVYESFTEGTIKLVFSQSNNKVFTNLTEVTFNVTHALLPGLISSAFGKNETLRTNESLLNVDASHSYKCNSVKSDLSFNQELNIFSAELDLSEVRVQAFMSADKKGEFSSERNCSSKEVSDVFPIAVGIALAGLVIIVLIAYFVGRRRNRRMAYQSV